VPLDSVPLDSVPLDSVPLDSVPLDSVPLDSVPLDSVPLDSYPPKCSDSLMDALFLTKTTFSSASFHFPEESLVDQRLLFKHVEPEYISPFELRVPLPFVSPDGDQRSEECLLKEKLEGKKRELIMSILSYPISQLYVLDI
jgi:hypothetical protein